MIFTVEDNIFKPCYSKCKTCNGEGTKQNNYCLECNDNNNYIIREGNCICRHYNNDTTAKTIDKCPIECKTCTLDSINNNLCTSCNVDDEYYHKLDEPFNTDSYYKCYHKNDVQAYYYLEDNIFKPCYSKCKICNGTGTDENNNCIECKDNQGYILDNGNCINNNKYEYVYDETSRGIKNNYEHTFIDINKEVTNLLKSSFSLTENDKIITTIYENNKNDSNETILDYVYEYRLENGTILNLSAIEEDVYVMYMYLLQILNLKYLICIRNTLKRVLIFLI